MNYSLFHRTLRTLPAVLDPAVLAPFALLALALLPAMAQTPLTVSLPDSKAIGALGADLFLQSGSTGMVLVVVRNGVRNGDHGGAGETARSELGGDDQVFFQGYGETAPGSNQLPTVDSVLRLCSLTKIFTTDVLVKLAADGTVRLDDPLQRYAPPGITVPWKGSAITLEDLATHTSGLPRELGQAPRDMPHFTYPDYGTRWRWLPNQRLRSTPGTAALYSNVAFDLLSDALHAAAHKQYAALLAERTLHPLHMGHTTFFPNAEQCRQLLRGAGDEGPCTFTEATAGSSGLYSTAPDMAIWLKYLLGDNPAGKTTAAVSAQAVHLLPAQLVSQKGLDHAGAPTGIGLGWIQILPADSPSRIVEKTGGGAGYETYIAINHARHTAIFLAATDGPGDSHLNLYNAANKLLLNIAGLPPLPAPPVVAEGVRRHRHRHRS